MDDVDYLVEDNARDNFAYACSQELEHFIFIKVLPTSVARILATRHTTMMTTDG